MIHSFFVGIIRAAHASPSRIMPRHRHPLATARGGRRFGLSAVHRSGAAPIDDLRRNLPGFAFARRHPRPEELSPMSSQSRSSRSPARLDPWTLAALLSTLRPLPPAPLFPRCASRSDQRPQCAGGRGLRSLPAVFAGARPALRSRQSTVSPDPFAMVRRLPGTHRAPSGLLLLSVPGGHFTLRAVASLSRQPLRLTFVLLSFASRVAAVDSPCSGQVASFAIAQDAVIFFLFIVLASALIAAPTPDISSTFSFSRFSACRVRIDS